MKVLTIIVSVLMCEIFSGYALAQGVKRLPFPDGTYVTDQAICRMSEGQRIQKFGDAVGSMVRNIEGSKLDNSYELQCETRNVVQTVNKVKFRLACEAEGEKQTQNGSWVKVDDRTFKVGNQTFRSCGRLIRGNDR